MSANSIKVQLELVISLSQLQELLRASEPKKSLCSMSFGNHAYLSKLPCEIRKDLRLLSLAFENDTSLLIPQPGPRRTLRPVPSLKVRHRLCTSIRKNALKGAFSPLTLFDSPPAAPAPETQKVKVNL